MKKDEQANVLLSLKNLYRLFTVKDYPVYSTGILGEKSKKGLTLVKFWDECLLYEWKSTRHGKMIFRKDGSQNRYHSEFCNRKESFPLYHIYIEEVLEGLNTETFGSQVLIFEKFLKGPLSFSARSGTFFFLHKSNVFGLRRPSRKTCR